MPGVGVCRVMDEFDVFMDAMSRNIAINQVINFAKNSSQRQFILITPQVNVCSWSGFGHVKVPFGSTHR